MKICIVAGGTGGHIYPGLAAAEELKKRDPQAKIFFVGSRGGLEKELIEREGYQIELIPARALLRKISYQALTAPFINLWGFFSSFFILLRQRPQVIASFGGYTALPVVMCGWTLQIPILVHEQNILPGLTNQFLSRFASRVALSFEGSLKYMRGQVTGNPVRSHILNLKKQPSASGRRVVVLGGSQGARSINRAIAASLEFFKDKNITLTHVIGQRDYAAMVEGLDLSSYPFYRPLSYLYNIEEAYANADLIVSRAGATALAEILVAGLPSVLVPFPYSAERHQDLNARFLKEAGAAEVLTDEQLEKLPQLIADLLKDQDGRLRKMSEAACFLAKPNAAAAVADLVLSLVKK